MNDPRYPVKDPQTDRVKMALVQGRKDLWNAHLNGFLGFVFNPVRNYVLDPVFAVSGILLPPIIRAAPVTEPLFLGWIQLGMVFVRLVYKHPDVIDIKSRAMNDARLSTQGNFRMPKLRPPSDFKSALQGAFAFTMSSLADMVSILLDRRKLTKWFDTMTEFKAYVDASGVGAELEEACFKPMVYGRLIDNVKILNDIQEILYKDRSARIATIPKDKLEIPIREGHRMMRFATAAYGTEMVRSALDRDATPVELESHLNAIAFHCGISTDDIKIVKVEDGGDMAFLRHFVAVDHVSESVVLALRGTLSISGALIDIQAMEAEYYGCKAHKGMAEMAESVWTLSGSKIKELFEDESLKDYAFHIVGHSLGAGTACLLNVKCHAEKLLGDRVVKCYGFAPPPTLSIDSTDDTYKSEIEKAIDHSLAYVHDNDCVPFLSVAAVRRLAALMDTVDNRTEHIWFYRRFKMFWEWEAIPNEIFDDVAAVEKGKSVAGKNATKLVIPARLVVWMKNTGSGTFDAYGCEANAFADENIFLNPDMVSDHMVEPYEDALDSLV